MARDYAKAKKKKSARNTRKQTTTRDAASGMKLFAAGVFTGVCLCLLTLWAMRSPGPLPAGQQAAEDEPVSAPPKPRFDFYDMLPEQTIEVETPEIEPARELSVPAAKEQFLLQAGSFRQREDADRRRAQLLLLGLEPNIQEATGENGRWYRVYLGPFESRAQMSRAQGLTAAQNIETLPLKRGTP
ncbi:MAG: SPOR domain-containing protein [Gammaproteobacteria bacterium]|nr:SPOR domain-containing protein [Gammaproteobacteria bacterium]